MMPQAVGQGGLTGRVFLDESRSLATGGTVDGSQLMPHTGGTCVVGLLSNGISVALRCPLTKRSCLLQSGLRPTGFR